MPYATRAQIEARLPSVKMTEEESGDRFDAAVAEALIWADAQVNTRLAKRYATPFESPYPDEIKQVAADFATGRTLRVNTESEASQLAADKWIADAEKAIEEILANGIPSLEEDPGEDLPPAENFSVHSGIGQTSKIWIAEW